MKSFELNPADEISSNQNDTSTYNPCLLYTSDTSISALANEIYRITMKSVSYTHLDVYKRQTVCLLPQQLQ